MYSNTGLLPCIHIGHLVPAETYSFTVNHIRSTFVYTNAVPQYAAFNGGKWSAYERKIRDYARKECRRQNGNLYQLTGISDKRIEIQGNSRQAVRQALDRMPEEPNIAIPSSMWTAGCCVRGQNVLGSFAVIGNNDPIKQRMNMSQMMVKKLAGLIGVNQLFPGKTDCNEKYFYVNLT